MDKSGSGKGNRRTRELGCNYFTDSSYSSALALRHLYIFALPLLYSELASPEPVGVGCSRQAYA